MHGVGAGSPRAPTIAGGFRQSLSVADRILSKCKRQRRVRLGNELQYDRAFEDVRLLVGVDYEGAPGRIGSTATSGYRKAVVERTFDGTEAFGGIAVLSAFGTHAARKDLLDFLLIALSAVFGVAVTWVLDPGSGRR